MACQLECRPSTSTSCSSLHTQRSYVAMDSAEDLGLSKHKRMRSSLRIAAQMASLVEPQSTRNRELDTMDNESQDGNQPPAKRRRVSNEPEPDNSTLNTEATWNVLKEDSPTEVPMEVEASQTVDTLQSDVMQAIGQVNTETVPQGGVVGMTVAGDEVSGAVGAQAVDMKKAELSGAVGGVDITEEAGASPVPDEKFKDDLEVICEVHPDCNPEYIREQLTLHINDPQRVSTVTFGIFENENYPKKADREEQARFRKEKDALMHMQLDLEAFLYKCPDPMAKYNIKKGDVTKHYYDHALVFLKSYFRNLQVNFIKATLRCSGFHLTPAFITLRETEETRQHLMLMSGKRVRTSKLKYRNFTRSHEYEYPEEPNEDFYYERLFLLNFDYITGHINTESEARRQRLEEAKANGKLHDCAICWNPEVLEEMMLSCNGGHLFCSDCIKAYAESLVAQGKPSFPCLDSTCRQEFSLCTLEKVLPMKTYQLALRTVQISQVREADIENLESCPFCPYAVIVPYDNTASLFHCENEECLQDSCRKCKKLAHIPYSCKEVMQVTFRTFVENQMAEAMIRVCPKCNLRFIKEEGCNTMTCSRCRTKICYICKLDITKTISNHFQMNKRCSNAKQNMSKLHQEEVQLAFNASAERFKSEHPEIHGMDLNLKSIKKGLQPAQQSLKLLLIAGVLSTVATFSLVYMCVFVL